MDAVIRVVVIYAFLLVVFRLAGKRTLSEATTFDLLLLLVISETTQQAMVGEDKSITHAALLILTFIAMELILSHVQQRSATVDKILDGLPVVVLADGVPLTDRLRKTRVEVEDILEAARETQGINTLDQIRLAVLERDGQLSIVPKDDREAGKG